MNKIIDIRPNELRRLMPLAMAYTLILASIYVLKPVRNALFLDQLGIAQLPYVLILVALIGGGISSSYSKLMGSARLNRLIPGTFVALIAHLAIFRYAFAFSGGWIYYAFYIWVNLYGVLAVSLIWLLANAAFNAREARRLFGFIGTGGIAGSVLGGLFTGWAASGLGTENLLLVSAGLIAASTGLVCTVPVGSPSVKASTEGGALRAVMSSALLKRIAGMGALVAVVAVVADIQFNEIVDAAFESKDEKTAFFGTFFAYLNGFSLAFQLLVTPWILKRFGVGCALFFLPMSMALGAVGVLLMAGLWGGIAVKVGDVGFRHAIHKAAVEVLFLPVPAELKKRSKIFIDTTIDNLATGLGALFVLILQAGFGVLYPHLSLLSLGLIAVWLWNLVGLRRAYVNAFRGALDRAELRADDFRVKLDGAVIAALVRALKSENPRHVAYALELLGTADEDLTSAIAPLLQHADADVRRLALLAMRPSPHVDLQFLVRGLLRDENTDVRVEALHFLRRQALSFDLDALRNDLQTGDPKIRTTALGYISRYGKAKERGLIDEAFVESVLCSGVSEERVLLVRVIGSMREWEAFLFALMHDGDAEVVGEVIRSFDCQSPDYAAWLLDRLAEPRHRMDAREALVKLGDVALPALETAWDSRPRLRLQIPRVAGEIPSQRAVDFLLKKLNHARSDDGFALVQALCKWHALSPGRPCDAERVDHILMARAGAHYEMTRLLQIFEQAQGQGVALLKRALRERRAGVLEQIFLLLEIRYSTEDMHRAYLGITSSEKATRANALEFLDNVFESHHKAILPVLIDADAVEDALAYGRKFFFDGLQTREDGMSALIDGDDPWLKACALNGVDVDDSPALIARVRACRTHAQPLIAETATRVGERLWGDERGRTTDVFRRGDAMLTAIEKVMALQNVDVFSEVATQHLAHLAAIAEEVTCRAGDVLYREDDPPRAMYLILEGRVRLHRGDFDVTIAGPRDAFGTWALFDDEPRVATATVLETGRLLCIERDNFVDLLADYVQITQGVLRAMSKRLRGLVARVQ